MKKKLTPEEKRKRRAASIGGLVGLFFAMLIPALSNNNYISDRGLAKEVRKGNELCPMAIDDFTRIDSFSMPKSKTFMQHATVTNIVKEEANLDTIRKYIEPGLLENTKTNSQLKSARNSKITFIYSFNDMNGEVFYEYTVTPDMYKE